MGVHEHRHVDLYGFLSASTNMFGKCSETRMICNMRIINILALSYRIYKGLLYSLRCFELLYSQERHDWYGQSDTTLGL